MKTKDMVLVAMFSGLTAVLSQIAVPLPFSPVPVTLQTFAVVLTGVILGSRRGALSMIVYALMGVVGLPVFAMGEAGLPVLIGPKGGYIFGFILAAYAIGRITERKQNLTYFKTTAAMFFGLLIIYVVGIIQLKIVLGLGLVKAVGIGAVPYLPMDTVKILIAGYLGCYARRALIMQFSH